MSTKYQGLPDIDTAPDVFETPDEPEPLLRPNDNGLTDDEVVKPQSELIDSSELPSRHKAGRIYGRNKFSLAHRPRLPSYRQRSDSSSSSEGYPKETPAARLRRLKAEIAEVEMEISSGSAGSSKLLKRKSAIQGDLIGELTGLKERLGKLDVEDDSRSSSGLKGRLEGLSKPLSVSSEKHSTSIEESPAGLSEIDKRLAKLEDLVGPSDPADTPPLLTTLNKHDQILTLLTQPRHLDAISRRVKLLLVDLDRAAAAARRNPTAQTSEKTVTLSDKEYASLQNLFTLLPRLDPLLPIIPPLLARLRSLSALHTSAGEVVEDLAKLKEDEKVGEEEVKELMEVVGGVQRGLDDASKAILTNWEGLQTRMKELEERVTRLDQ